MAEQYPTLRFLERHGGGLAYAVAATPLIAAIIAVLSGASDWWIVAGLAAGGFLLLAARSYVEMIRLMTDMLLPK
jgi:hypothetical protein